MPKIKKTIAEDLSGLTIAINEGETLSFSLDDYTPEIQRQLAYHGLSQKLGDSVAKKEIDTPEEIQETISGVNDKLLAGDWKAARESSGGAGRVTLLAEALAEMTGKALEEAKAVVEQLSDDQKKALRADVNVKATIDQIKARRSAEKAAKDENAVDIGALFGQAS